MGRELLAGKHFCSPGNDAWQVLSFKMDLEGETCRLRPANYFQSKSFVVFRVLGDEKAARYCPYLSASQRAISDCSRL
jgi:hypothetical protein